MSPIQPLNSCPRTVCTKITSPKISCRQFPEEHLPRNFAWTAGIWVYNHLIHWTSVHVRFLRSLREELPFHRICRPFSLSFTAPIAPKRFRINKVLLSSENLHRTVLLFQPSLRKTPHQFAFLTAISPRLAAQGTTGRC